MKEAGENYHHQILNTRLVSKLCSLGAIRSKPIEEAFAAVPRHVFLSKIPIEDAYEDKAIAIKVKGGHDTSSSSQPSLMATMLENLSASRGNRILEIGTGSGYNAALLSHIVGDSGEIITIDIDGEIVNCAREIFSSMKLTNVKALATDGGYGCSEASPFDGIIVTAAAADIPPAWWQQIRIGGRLVVPLSINGAKTLITFEKHSETSLRSLSVKNCGFIDMKGAFANTNEEYLRHPSNPALRLSVFQRVDNLLLLQSIGGPWQEIPVKNRAIASELRGGFMLWLAIKAPAQLAKLHVDRSQDYAKYPSIWGSDEDFRFTFGLADSSGLALLDFSIEGESGGQQLNIRHYGTGNHLATQLIEYFEEWVSAGKPTVSSLRVTAVPPCFLPATNSGAVVSLPNARLILDWG